MAAESFLTDADLDALRRFNTCMISNAIETFDARLRNTGFADSRIRCIFEEFAPVVGYAVTGRLSSGEPPIVGGGFRDRADFWNSILQIPAPRILVLEDTDHQPGRGAFVGDMHAAILKALGCVAYVTNGAVRELPAVQAMNFQLFAGNVAVSHAYAHIFEVGAKIMVGGMEVHTGDLLHGDRHGILTIPLPIAAKVPRVATELAQAEQEVISLCQSPDFSVPKLREVMSWLRRK